MLEAVLLIASVILRPPNISEKFTTNLKNSREDSLKATFARDQCIFHSDFTPNYHNYN